MTIKEIRSHYKLTQRQLSDITGIPLRTIENWESGSRSPSPYIPDLVQAKVELEYRKALNTNKDNT